jgi:aminoglycoside/choline kinase family phosphotransferase
MSRPPAPGPLPAGVADITPAWLGAALREGGVVAAGDVAAVEATVIGEDHGFTGVVARLHVTYDAGGSGPATMVAKLPTAERGADSGYRRRLAADPDGRRKLLERSAHEVAFYRDTATAGGAPVPRLLFGAVDDANERVVLLLEDVGPAQQPDLLTGMSADESRAVLRAMAGFHARWWEQSAAFPGWLPRWDADHRRRQERFAQAVDPFLERHAEALPDGAPALVEGLRTQYGDSLAALAALPPTIIHCDLHADNVLLARTTDSPPTAFVLDWQTVALGPVVVDLNLLLVGSLATSTRRQHERRLLAEYLELLDSRGVLGVRAEELVAAYRLATQWHLATIVTWLATVDRDALSWRERLIVERLISDPRVFNAALDHAS